MWPFRRNRWPDRHYIVTISHGELEAILVALGFLRTVMKTGRITERAAKNLHKKDVIPARSIGKLVGKLRRAKKQGG